MKASMSPALKRFRPTAALNMSCRKGRHHHHAEKPDHHGGEGRQEFHHRFHDLPEPGRGDLGQINGRHHPQGHGYNGCQRGHGERGHDQRKNTETGPDPRWGTRVFRKESPSTETFPKIGTPSMKRKITMRERVRIEAEAMQKKKTLIPFSMPSPLSCVNALHFDNHPMRACGRNPM